MSSNVVLVSGVQQSDSVIYILVSILFQIIFPFRLLRSIEQSSLCYTVGPWLSILCFIFSPNFILFIYFKHLYWSIIALQCCVRLSILNRAMCTCQSQTPNLSHPLPLLPW